MRRLIVVCAVLASFLSATGLGLAWAPAASAFTTRHPLGTPGLTGPPVHDQIADVTRDLYADPGGELYDYFDHVATGAEYEDWGDLVWCYLWPATSHAWDADMGPGYEVYLDEILGVPVGRFVGQNTWQKAQRLWGMAIGSYERGNVAGAYDYLGHVVHLLSDMAVPAHVHADEHAVPYDECYEKWMTVRRASLTEDEVTEWGLDVEIEIPDGVDDRLYYLFYTVNQVADYFASDKTAGDTNDPEGWMTAVYKDTGIAVAWDAEGTITSWLDGPTDPSRLVDNDEGNNDDDGDLSTIRRHTYPYLLRAIGALYDFFAQETDGSSRHLTVVIDSVEEIDSTWVPQPHDFSSSPEYFVDVRIGDDPQLDTAFWFSNEGQYVSNKDNITPGWAFARSVGTTGVVPVTIQLWDRDLPPINANDHSDIFYGGGLDFTLYVDLATQKMYRDSACTVYLGDCGTQVKTRGNGVSYSSPASRVAFTVWLPGPVPSGPEIPDFPDQEVYEGQTFDPIDLDEDIAPDVVAQLTWSFDTGDDPALPPEERELQVVIEPGTNIATVTAPLADWTGTRTVTFIATDEAGRSAGDEVTFTVLGVNDPPSFTVGPDQTVLEDAGAQTVSPWASGLSAGPGEDTEQALTFCVVGNTNPDLFAAGPTIQVVASAGEDETLVYTTTLTYTPAPDASGSAEVTVLLTDDGGTANGGIDTSAPETFTITVTPVNDAPVGRLDDEAPASQTVQYSDTMVDLLICASDVDSSGDDLTATASGLPDGISLEKASDTGGDLPGEASWTVSGTVADAAGTYPVSVTTSDGEDTCAVAFTIEVTPEDASVSYDGDTLGVVGTRLALRAVVVDSAASGFAAARAESGDGATIGDITKMLVAFDITKASGGLVSTVYVPVVDTGPVGDGIGSASASWESTAEGAHLVATRVVADGSGGENQWYAAGPAPEAAINLYLDLGQFVTGGGWVLDPDAGTHGNFGFNARYNKQGKAQGQFLYLWRGEYDGVPANFRIKSNALDGLSFKGDAYPLSGTLMGTANLQVVSALDGTLLYSEGNSDFTATAYDAGEGAGDDRLSVMFGGGLTPKRFADVALEGGGIVIHLK